MKSVIRGVARAKVETLVTCTPVRGGRVQGVTSLAEPKLELPGESSLRG